MEEIGIMRYNKVMELAKLMGRENEVVKAIVSNIQKAQGICVACQEEGEVLRVSIAVYTDGRQPREIKENRFVVEYCVSCLLGTMGIYDNSEGLYV